MMPGFMKSLLISIFAIFQLLSVAHAQTSRYPYDSIPRFLRIGADAVVRSSQLTYTIISENKAYLDFKIAVTLLNENADEYNYVAITYDQLIDVSHIRATAYDENGKPVWFLKKSEIFDFKDFSGPEYLDDSRIKAFKFPSLHYPYTIEFSYRHTTEILMLNPADYFQSGTSVSVERAGIQCIIPKDVSFRYTRVNMKSPTDSLWIRDNLVLTWQEENIPAKEQKAYAPDVSKTMPVLYSTTDRFNLRGYAGDLSTWKSFGAWVNKIIEGRDILSKPYADEVLSLVGQVAEPREKVRILYEYLQRKTRYFSISYGIGGNQPIPADQVAQNGFGDCKALSNYMKAMLKVAGIESYYTLVNAGDGEDIKPDFPSDQFNHVILCVPINRDTIWLECTDQTVPFGYLGSFTCDRYVLVVTPEGGKIQRTPAYGKNENSIITHSEVELYGSGDALIKFSLYHTGLMYDALKAMSEEKEDNRKQLIAGLLENPSIVLEKETYRFGRDKVPFGNADFEVFIRDLSSKGGNRLFVCPSLLSKFAFVWEDPAEVELATSYLRIDTVRIAIPLGYMVEYLPMGTKVEGNFGKYSSEISSDHQYVYFVRNLEINEAVYPREKYAEFYDFISQIAYNDRKMLILKTAY